MRAEDLNKVRPKEAFLVIKALGLKKKYEEILMLRYVEEKSIDEIADILGIEPQSVSNLNRKARKQFDKYIDEIK